MNCIECMSFVKTSDEQGLCHRFPQVIPKAVTDWCMEFVSIDSVPEKVIIKWECSACGKSFNVNVHATCPFCNEPVNGL